jgi:hypothetical protein
VLRAAGAILVLAGILVTLYGLFTMVYAGDVEGGEPAIGMGIAIAAGGIAATVAGIWALRRYRG